jgi:chromosome segregation ATPase
MLQAAIAAEDAGDESEKEQLTTQVDDVITQLKANLEVTEEASTAEKSTMLHQSTESISILQSQLQESQATIGSLRRELEEVQTQMGESARCTQQNAAEAESATQSIKAAHLVETEELKKQYELEISSLHHKLQELELLQQERAEQTLKELEDARKRASEAGDTKTSQLLENQKSLHSKAVGSLENDLALERKAIKQSAVNVSLLEKKIEELKTNLDTATSKAGEYQKTIEARQDQLANQDRELQGQGGVIKSLQDEITALQQANDAEAEALKRSSAKNIAELQAHIASLRSAANRSSEESAASETHIQEELVRKEQEIFKLGQVIERLQDEVQSVHEAKSNELDENLLQIRKEHDQIIMALKAEHQDNIDGLAKSHNGVVDKLAVEARNNRTAHERQIQALNDERSEIQKSLENTTKLMKESHEEAEKRMQEAELKHCEALQAVYENLQKVEKALTDSEDLHKRKIDQVEQTTDATIKKLEEKMRVLEGQSTKEAAALRSSREDLEAAQQQVESLKQVLQTLEKDSQSKEDHQAGSLTKAIAEAEAATKALSEKSTSLEMAEKNHAKAIENLRSGHEAELKTIHSDLSQKHDDALRKLKMKHEDLLTAQNKLEEAQKDEVEQLKAEHDRVLKDTDKLIEKIQHAHIDEMEGQKLQLAEEHNRALKNTDKLIEQIQNAHIDEIEQIQHAHVDEIEELKLQLAKEHDRALKDTDKLIEQIQNAHIDEIEELKLQVADEHLGASKQLAEGYSKKAEDAETAHRAALDDLHSTHEKSLLDLRTELEASHLQSAANARESHSAIVKELNAQLEQQKADLAEIQLEMEKVSQSVEDPELANIRKDLQVSNEALTVSQAEAERLATEAKDMKQRLEQDRETIKQLESCAKEASKVRADSSSREVQALREQLDGALQEAETQRAHSDAARKELQRNTEKMNQSKVRIGELEAKLQTVNEKLDLEPKVSTPNGTRKRKGNKGHKKSPRLSQNKSSTEQEDGEVIGGSVDVKEGESHGSSIQGTVGVLSRLPLLFLVDSR